ncbi:MAG: hypothetical protein LW857_02730 [Verrucomicrobiae bacterium]|jgi:hypothetical protein|nr:hypothetical protein [Verrucomicrobiae bacterium]
MAGFDDSLVREFFEVNGFFVRQSRKAPVTGKRKRPEAEGEVFFRNPRTATPGERAFQLFGADLVGLGDGVAVIRDWHGQKAVTATTIRRGDFLDFIRKDACETAKEAWASLPEGEAAALIKVLILPGLPAQEPARSESIRLLKEAGVDHVISLRTIVENLVQHAEAPTSRESPTLALLRLLRVYDMVRTTQLELFGGSSSSSR